MNGKKNIVVTILLVVSAEVLQQGSVSNAQRVLPDACGRTHSR